MLTSADMLTPQGQFSTENELMDLRLTILKSISLIWENDYSDDPTLRQRLINGSIKEIKAYYKEALHYTMPFENFGLKYIDALCAWNLFGDQTWTKPSGEKLVLSLPRLPQSLIDKTQDNTVDRTTFLMQYYQHFPTFLGAVSNIPPSEPVNEIIDNYNPMDDFPSLLELDNIDHSRNIDNFSYKGDDSDLGLSEDKYLSFGAVTIKLISAAWENPNLMSLLHYPNWMEYHGIDTGYDEGKNIQEIIKMLSEPNHDNAEKIREITDIYHAFIKGVLKNNFNYICPWEVDLIYSIPQREYSFWQTFKEDNGDINYRWRPGIDLTNEKWDPIIRNWIQLAVPSAPRESDKGRMTTALASYNSTRPAYPLTCS